MGRDIQNFYPSLVDKFFLARAFSKNFSFGFRYWYLVMRFSKEKW